MGIINLNIDDEIKLKLEKIVKSKGLKDINSYILDTLKKDISLQEIALKKKDLMNTYDEVDEVIKILSEISENLSESQNQDEKIKILVEFDEFIKKNKTLIQEKCPNLLISVLNSL